MPQSLDREFLVHSDFLIQQLGGVGRPPQILLRRSISASYYSAWHCICNCWASRFDSGLEHMLCRCPEHTKVKNAAIALKSRKCGWMDGNQCCPEMDKMCEDFIRLQKSRHDADYDIGMIFRKSDAVESYQRAKRIIETIQWAEANARKELDALLLDSIGIKPRHS